MDVLRTYTTSFVSMTKRNPKLSISIALSVVVGSYVCLSAIPNAIFYCGYKQCPSEERCNGPPALRLAANGSDIIQQDVSWTCNGTTIRGLLLRPSAHSQDSKPSACIIMAHGIGHVVHQGLMKYAINFCTNGYVILLFDYRTFGISDGVPRHQACPSNHVQDWISAINYMKNSHADIVDASRIGLWGTSFSGGHVLVVSAKVKGIRAVVSQVPFIAFQIPNEKLVVDAGKILKLLYGCIATKIRSFVPFVDEFYFRITASRSNDGGKIALLDLEELNETDSQRKWINDEWNGEDLKEWKNVLSCRNVWEILNYKPYEYIAALNQNGTAVFYVCSEKDYICPLQRVEYAASITKQSQMHTIDGMVHYDAYQGEIRDSVILKQAAFYNKYV